ncbi:type II secretion system protein [Marinobacter sp. LN3S78]|uniref:type IV pilus modification PilV family protein n=1 Tax=Marinobacter sp. LN3S78 TaxID=3382300 RepID=UPI00387B115A
MSRLPRIRLFQQGATLVELVMTIVIISVAIGGVVGAFSLIAGRSADPLNQTRAVALAQLYYDEVAARYYDEQTPLGGGAVSGDDVDCNTIPGGNLNPDDNGYPGFEVSVNISCAGNDTGIGVDAELAKRVDITVTAPSGTRYVFSAYRGNF